MGAASLARQGPSHPLSAIFTCVALLLPVLGLLVEVGLHVEPGVEGEPRLERPSSSLEAELCNRMDGCVIL